MMRHINLNPKAEELEVVKITYSKKRLAYGKWLIEPMRFLPHVGRARP